jgi:hypothetical protein
VERFAAANSGSAKKAEQIKRIMRTAVDQPLDLAGVLIE